MKAKKNYGLNYFGEFKRVLVQHINENIKDYLILSIIFIIGVMAGVMLINNSNEKSKNEVSGYINGFVESVKNDSYQIDKTKLAKLSIIKNLKIVLVIWIAGTTIIGIPLIYIIIAYKGLCIGYTVSAIIATLGIGKRNYFFVGITIFAKHSFNSGYINAKCKCIKTL